MAIPQAELAAFPAWWPELALWLGLGLLIAAVAGAAGAWALVARLRALREDARSLESLQELKRVLDRLLAAREELDLRRIEHLLIDLRDGSRRLEELLLRTRESRDSESEALVPLGNQGLGERVVNRLLAMGCEHVELVTSAEELARLGDGHVLVEARRDGVLCKGRVSIRAGRIDAVALQPAFPAFP
jgi:hypothetical protein